MYSEPELDGKYLGTITNDFVKVADTIKDASYQIRKREISAYPIFVMCKEATPIGQIFIAKKEAMNLWNYSASFLDEFLQRQLIAADKEEEFKVAYRDPEEFCCLFVVDVKLTGFIFIPYPEDGALDVIHDLDEPLS
ncbi:MAG TPA: hypothetical protein VF691_17140 [Cytophagaceae bacterium]|jgi:hypothetical protein